MINYIGTIDFSIVAFVGILFAFGMTCLAIAKLNRFLPKDIGRQFAVEGKLSAGKPRGAGIIFVLVFAAATVLFANLSAELVIYLVLIIVEMLTGFFDDAAEKPWGEYLKGFLDLLVAAVVAMVYIHYNGTVVTLAFIGKSFVMPTVIFALCVIILVWASINVVNCTDGVDGLSGTLTIISVMTFFIIDHMVGADESFSFCILLFAVCELGYLWYNATPSKLLMGDAGSRAQGIFLAIVALKSGCPFLFIPVAIVFILDGGLGLVKVALLRFLKIHILKNVTTPLHDHARKRLEWSNAQVVFRFAIIQIVASLATVYLIMISL